MSSLQKAFFREKKGSSTAPYTSNRGELSDEQRKRLIQTAVKQSERGRVARVAGLSDEELKACGNDGVSLQISEDQRFVLSFMTVRTPVFYG